MSVRGCALPGAVQRMQGVCRCAGALSRPALSSLLSLPLFPASLPLCRYAVSILASRHLPSSSSTQPSSLSRSSVSAAVTTGTPAAAASLPSSIT